MKDVDECIFIHEMVAEQTHKVLSQLSEKDAQEAVVQVLEYLHTKRQAALRRCAKREANEIRANKIIILPWEDAAAVVMDNCNTLDINLTTPQLHMLMFYAEGLCIRHFNQRLFNVELRAAVDAMMYLNVPEVQPSGHHARADIVCPMQPESARLLRAVSSIAFHFADKDWQTLLDDELIWMSGVPDDVVTTDDLKSAFGRKCDTPQSEMYYLAESAYTALLQSS